MERIDFYRRHFYYHKRIRNKTYNTLFKRADTLTIEIKKQNERRDKS